MIKNTMEKIINPILKKLVIKPTLSCYCNCSFCKDRQLFYQGQKILNPISLEIIKNIFSQAADL
jgi:L-lysine 2,3-aminomutase